MKLELFVCPTCHRAALRNPPLLPNDRQLRCMNDTMPMSYVHDVDLKPADQHSAQGEK